MMAIQMSLNVDKNYNKTTKGLNNKINKLKMILKRPILL